MQKLVDKLPKHKIMMNPKSYRMAHPVYSQSDIVNIQETYRQPKDLKDRIAKFFVIACRTGVDTLTWYNPKKMKEEHWLNRCIFLETVAGVPGMVGGMQRHFRSLRKVEHDHGWIHHLLQEAENERMHLFFFTQLRKPGKIFRFFITCTQLFLSNVNFFMYLVSPDFCHRFVGYLEE